MFRYIWIGMLGAIYTIFTVSAFQDLWRELFSKRCWHCKHRFEYEKVNCTDTCNRTCFERDSKISWDDLLDANIFIGWSAFTAFGIFIWSLLSWVNSLEVFK